MDEKILIVDDNAEIREITAKMLAKHGFRVAMAANGMEAIERMREDVPDALVLDVMMPGMSGWEVLDFVKNNEATATTPVIMMTARGRAEEVEAGYEYGADYYLTKPCSKDQLLHAVGTLLGRDDLMKGSSSARGERW